MRGGAILRLAENAVGGGGHQLPAQLVDLQHRGTVLGLAGLAVGQRLRSAEDAVLALEFRQPLLVLVHARLQILKLAGEPS